MTRLLCVVVLAACGGHSGARSGPRSGATAHSHGPVASDDRLDTDRAAAAATARDCDALFAHAVALGVAERPEDQKLTADERASMQAQLRTSFAPKCEQMTSRGYECALAATTLTELDGCGG